LRLLILVAREGFLKDKCVPRAKKFEHHWRTGWYYRDENQSMNVFYQAWIHSSFPNRSNSYKSSYIFIHRSLHNTYVSKKWINEVINRQEITGCVKCSIYKTLKKVKKLLWFVNTAKVIDWRCKHLNKVRNRKINWRCKLAIKRDISRRFNLWYKHQQSSWRSQPKNLGWPKNLGGSKMFDFRPMTQFC